MWQKFKNTGFTLIELLTVMFIIGILSGVAIPQYMRSVRRAEMTEGLTHGKTILDAATRYKAVNGEKPTDFNQLDVAFIGASTSGSTFNDGNFIYRLPTNFSYISATSTKGDYELRFQYPTTSDSGVEAAIACCPGSSSRGQWLCSSLGAAKVHASSAIGEECFEIF